MKPEEIDKIDQEFIREMLSQELNRVKVTKGNEDLKGKDPQDKKGKAKLADKSPQPIDTNARHIMEPDIANKRQRSVNSQKKLSTAKGGMKYLKDTWVSMDSE